MKNLYYTLTVFFALLIIFYCFLPTTLTEGLSGNTQLPKDNLNNIEYLNTRMDALEKLSYIREKHPELLGDRVHDETITVKDIVSYLNSGVDDNTDLIDMITERMANIVPKKDNINITGV